MKPLDFAALRPGFAIRPDVPDKLRAAPYHTDLTAPGLLHAKVLRSAVPHARLLHVDTDAAMRMPGVAAIITAADIPGRNIHGARVRWDQPVLCTDRLRHIGDPIAAVAADTPENAARAVAAIRIRTELLPVLSDAALALTPGAPLLHASGNLLHSRDYTTGDVDAVLHGAAHRVDAVYDTGRQAHAFMETEGGLVEPDGAGGLIIRAGTHDAFADRADLAIILGLDPDKIRVIAGVTGGLVWRQGRAVRAADRLPAGAAHRAPRAAALYARREHGRGRQAPCRPHARPHRLRCRRAVAGP